MKQLEKPIIKATGGIHIGKTFLRSFQFSWPFGKVEVYEDGIILKVQYIRNYTVIFFQLISAFFPKTMKAYVGGELKDIQKDIKLPYSDIKGYYKRDIGIAGPGIRIIHTNSQYAPFLQVWIFKNKARAIIGYLNSRDIYEQELSKEDSSIATNMVYSFLGILNNKKLKIALFIFVPVLVVIIGGMLILQHWVVERLDLGERQAEMARDWLEKQGPAERQIEVAE